MQCVDTRRTSFKCGIVGGLPKWRESIFLQPFRRSNNNNDNKRVVTFLSFDEDDEQLKVILLNSFVFLVKYFGSHVFSSLPLHTYYISTELRDFHRVTSFPSPKTAHCNRVRQVVLPQHYAR